MKKAFSFCALVLTAQTAFAGGSYIPDIGARALGRGGAFVVGADDLLAVQYNPAALTRLQRTSFFLDFAAVAGKTTFTREPGLTQFDPNTGSSTVIDPNIIYAPAINDPAPMKIPTLLMGGTLETAGCDECAFAFGLRAPYGIDADWDERGPQRYATIGGGPILVLLSAAYAQPITPWFKVGVGAAAVYINMIKRLKAQSTSDGLENPDRDLILEANLSDWSYTYNAGFLIEPTTFFAIGGMYERQIPLNLQGKVKITAPFFPAGLPNSLSLGATVTAKLPNILKGGVLIRPIPDLELEADLVRYEWSSFKEFPLTLDELPIDIGVEVPKVSFKLNYKDTINPRFGVEYKGLRPLRLRAGFYTEKRGIPPETMSPSDVDGDKKVYTGGFSYDFGTFDVDFAVAHFDIEPTVTSQSTSTSVNLFGPSTIIGNGRYEPKVNIFVVGFHYFPGRDKEDR